MAAWVWMIGRLVRNRTSKGLGRVPSRRQFLSGGSTIIVTSKVDESYWGCDEVENFWLYLISSRIVGTSLLDNQLAIDMGKSCRYYIPSIFNSEFRSLLHGVVNLSVAPGKDWSKETRKACRVHASVFHSIEKVCAYILTYTYHVAPFYS